MNIKILLASALLSVSCLTAMDVVVTKPISDETVTFEIEDTLIELPACYVKLIKTIHIFIQWGRQRELLSWPKVRLKVWRDIESQLAPLYGIVNKVCNQDELRKRIKEDYGKLDSNHLIEVIGLSDYFNMPALIEIALEALTPNLSVEQLVLLPMFMRNKLLFDKALRLLGPVEFGEVRRLDHNSPVIFAYVASQIVYYTGCPLNEEFKKTCIDGASKANESLDDMILSVSDDKT